MSLLTSDRDGVRTLDLIPQTTCINNNNNNNNNSTGSSGSGGGDGSSSNNNNNNDITQSFPDNNLHPRMGGTGRGGPIGRSPAGTGPNSPLRCPAKAVISPQ
ncbi:hypothetical protein SK128_003716 [Halocaridina rubra]|uniref:Uncharacterized protein n=1 Tax=Halocaridina rubra TaxID=373956 RepID=A0AAN9AHB4_HALRR